MKAMATDMIPSACPSCGKVLDAATHPTADDIRPKVGDISICFYCGNLMAFGDELTLRKLTDAESNQLADDRGVIALQRVRAEYFKAKEGDQ
jgi:hypothetical protein